MWLEGMHDVGPRAMLEVGVFFETSTANALKLGEETNGMAMRR
jgi:hypothetical protein